jgi:Family of unknown function (DUF5302)
MAATQSGSEASPTPAKPAAAASQSATDAGVDAAEADTADQAEGTKADLDEVKRKFREALDRKRNAHASANADGSHETGKVHGSQGPATSRRSFRRKSGSS